MFSIISLLICVKSKESWPKGPGFGLPPKGALDLNQRSTGVLEYWSNGVMEKAFPGR
jgi:hypothetical protein